MSESPQEKPSRWLRAVPTTNEFYGQALQAARAEESGDTGPLRRLALLLVATLQDLQEEGKVRLASLVASIVCLHVSWLQALRQQIDDKRRQQDQPSTQHEVSEECPWLWWT